MDSPSAAAESRLPCAAGSASIPTTGQGNVIGNPVVPVIKLSANPLTVATMSEHVDVDLSAMLRIEMNLDQAADAALAMLERTINGRLTAAEVLRHNEFVLTKLYRSA
jgi:(2R)-sulfolactate sulfo-lyase subunit beta